MKKANDIKQLRGALKQEIISLMEKGHKITEHIKLLKWASADACDTYNRYRINMKPETEEQMELAIAAADIFRPIRKACLRQNTAKKRVAMWEKKKQFGVKARHLQLLYGMLGGKTYSEMEPIRNKCPDIMEMINIIDRLVDRGDLNNDLIKQAYAWLNPDRTVFETAPLEEVYKLIPLTSPCAEDIVPVYCNVTESTYYPPATEEYIKEINIVLC